MRNLLLCWLIGFAPLAIVAQENLSRDEVEQQLESLQADITRLQHELESARSEYSREQRSLKSLDLDIQRIALALRELAEQRAGHEGELTRLEKERNQYLSSLKARKIALSEQVVAAYQLGRESRLKLLLNQDDPDRVGRMLAYYDYVSKAQAGQIRELREALETLDRMQADIDAQLIALNEVEQQHIEESNQLQSKRLKRAEAVSALANRIGSSEARLSELQQNRSDLEALLDRLGEALADIPSEIGDYRTASELRGSLPLPVSGRVLHAFGQTRMGGMSWHGWLIEARAGSEVRAIAYGRVAYADWLRGYGLLLIIDHGEGIMSLYGNNESLLFDVGDWVLPGAVVSTVGTANSGGQGLYFELRNQGKAVDPATWIQR
ncbi:MAG: peptidoglycan DD-metalloendopeptidase family protein [Gammaproteobacteria bacterium]|nr:peptidoglycan DD-metalloendopeptidase family protein [Gammaproteobacteria bacterium]